MRIRRSLLSVVLALSVLAGISGATVADHDVACEPGEMNSEQVSSGVTLTWVGAYYCLDAHDAGSYNLTVEFTNEADSTESVTIDNLTLFNTSPRPFNQGPEANGSSGDLPITVAPGETGNFNVHGDYELIETDEGKKANLNFRVGGSVDDEPLALGLNVLIRAEGVELEEDGSGPPEGVPPGPPEDTPSDDGSDEEGGPPDWVPGPPPWAGGEEDDEGDGPPEGVPGGPPADIPAEQEEDSIEGLQKQLPSSTSGALQEGDIGPPPGVPPGPPAGVPADIDGDEDNGPPEGVEGPPDWAGNHDDNDGPPINIPTGPPDGVPADDDGDEDNGPPEGVEGPPAWAGSEVEDDSGPPEGVPGGPPDSVPADHDGDEDNGPPEGIPGGPPDGVPGGD